MDLSKILHWCSKLYSNYVILYFFIVVLDSPEFPIRTSRAHSVATGSMFDLCTLNAAQFVNLLGKFLGELPSR